ncbi:MAG TPA: hypothetical protein VFI70_09795 [Nitrososphaeraceae archaeon]|nr:hypothetical protein [Nitrososphaeraceae archaeon]
MSINKSSKHENATHGWKQRKRLQQMSTKKQQQIDWRKSQVFELSSKGYSQSDIARVLQIDKSVICRDLAFLRQQSKQNIRKYIDERLPEEYEKCLVGLTAILREAWNISQQPDIDKREKVQALSLARDCYTLKLDLLTNATVIDDAVRFMARHQNQNQTKEKDKDESKKHNEDENKDKVINEFEIKDEASGTAVATANQVFLILRN